MLLANFNGKEHLRHRAVSLRQHGFLVDIYSNLLAESQAVFILRLITPVLGLMVNHVRISWRWFENR